MAAEGIRGLTSHCLIEVALLILRLLAEVQLLPQVCISTWRQSIVLLISDLVKEGSLSFIFVHSVIWLQSAVHMNIHL